MTTEEQLEYFAEQNKLLREALEYHMQQTRPIQKTIEALALSTLPAEQIIARHDAKVLWEAGTFLKDKFSERTAVCIAEIFDELQRMAAELEAKHG